MSVIHNISKLLPDSIINYMRPYWHRLVLFIQYFYLGGRLKFSWDLQCFVARKYCKGQSSQRMPVAIRSFREFLRWMQFSHIDNFLIAWLRSLDKYSVLWDIGASNGFEGFYCHHMTKCKVIFVEPYTPSIESIMKTAYLQSKLNMLSKDRYEIIQAACSNHSGYEKLVTHTKPTAGENYNSIEHGIAEYCRGGREDMNQPIAQWVSCLCLDDLHFEYDIDLPTHLKIDVDGLEILVLKGADQILSTSCLRECVIEVNDSNGPLVIEIMNQYGFKKQDELIHCNQNNLYTADYFFRRQ